MVQIVINIQKQVALNHLVSSLDSLKIKDISNKEFPIDHDYRPNCPHCNSSIIKKNGKTSNGTQKYLCLNTKCKRSFSSHTDSFFIWIKKTKISSSPMIEYTLDGLSVRNISTKLSIPVILFGCGELKS